ncbi:tetraacyldisaccharide 4'-kinase [bacterium]|nr:tetraacyldisaccharide 4'-kinase [bacterium]
MKLTEPKYFYKKWGISTLLFPLSLLYRFGDNLNRAFSHPYKSKAKVICIGNIVLGGVGKTPIVIEIIKYFLSKNIRVGVISRGYGGTLSSNTPIIVDTKKYTGSEIGDEPYLVASKFKNVPVCICKDRKKAAKLLENKVDVIIMDDGFQNYKLKKDIRIAVFDGIDGIGNGYIFPAGPLRQSLKSGLKGVNLAIIMRKNNPQLENKIKKYGISVINGKTVPTSNLKEYKGKKVIAFAGIGKPQKFYKTLTDNDIKIIQKINFPDHYLYTEEDIKKLKNLAKSKKLPILTTMKDYVKIPDSDKKNFTPIDIEVKFDNEKVLFKTLS